MLFKCNEVKSFRLLPKNALVYNFKNIRDFVQSVCMFVRMPTVCLSVCLFSVCLLVCLSLLQKYCFSFALFWQKYFMFQVRRPDTWALLNQQKLVLVNRTTSAWTCEQAFGVVFLVLPPPPIPSSAPLPPPNSTDPPRPSFSTFAPSSLVSSRRGREEIGGGGGGVKVSSSCLGYILVWPLSRRFAGVSGASRCVFVLERTNDSSDGFFCLFLLCAFQFFFF